MSAFNGYYGLPPQICSHCGDEFPEIDEATELCDACSEWIFDAALNPTTLEDRRS